MAKTKKAQSTESPAAASNAAKPAGKPEAKGAGGSGTSGAKAAKKAAKAPKPAGPPLIDTSLAAQSAARMVANRDLLGRVPPQGAEGRESGAFKQLKESLAKPAAQGPASFLQNTAPPKKSNVPFGGRNQIGHNQRFGADVNRAGIPRRTGGG